MKNDYNRRYYIAHQDQLRQYSKDYYASHKGPCLAYARRKARILRDKKRIFADTAKDRPCADCNKCFPSVCMDFDHPPGSKEFAIAPAIGNRSVSFERLKLEVEKCEVVCANCHRVRTHLK